MTITATLFILQLNFLKHSHSLERKVVVIMIEVAVPTSHADDVEKAIDQCCAETGDTLLGRRYYSEVNELFLVVQLLHDVHLSKHIPILSHALQHMLIHSFVLTQGTVVKVSSPDILNCICNFPLSSGDSWVPSAHDLHTVYLNIHRPTLNASQSAWLHLQETSWSFL